MIVRVFALYSFNRRVMVALALVAAGALANGLVNYAYSDPLTTRTKVV